MLNDIQKGVLITGGAGFIGSHLVDRMVQLNVNNIIVVDDLSSGNYSYIQDHIKKNQIHFYHYDLNDIQLIEKLVNEVDTVFHLAANPVVRTFDQPEIYFRQNILLTYNLLNVIRNSPVKNFLFTSSSTIYGIPEVIPTPEEYGPLMPISHYGSSKLACESLISSYCHIYGITGYIFRLANVVGYRNTHGIIWDFFQKIKKNKDELIILGDGNQLKSYLYIEDCINAIISIFDQKFYDKINIYNIGNSDSVDVLSIANIVSNVAGLPNIRKRFITLTEDGGGWLGDVKHMMLDISKMMNFGYMPTLSSKEAISKSAKDTFTSYL